MDGNFFTSETFLAILSALLGGVNILQLIFFRSTKKKYSAEAQKAEVEVQQAKADMHQDQYDYVNEQLSKIQQEYYSLAAKYRETMTAHLQEIDQKCNEIAELKSKLVYFKGLRCYCSDCANRIKESPYKKNDTESKVNEHE